MYAMTIKIIYVLLNLGPSPTLVISIDQTNSQTQLFCMLTELI